MTFNNTQRMQAQTARRNLNAIASAHVGSPEQAHQEADQILTRLLTELDPTTRAVANAYLALMAETEWWVPS